MKFNWKIAVAALLVVGAIVWAFTSTRAQSYSGTNLSFDVGGGPVTIVNPSDDAIPVQIVGTGTRGFSVSSNIDGVSGNSTRLGTGTSATQTFLFDLPVGSSEFAVLRGANVQFVAATDVLLEASASPMTTDNVRSTLVVAVVVVLGALFYISSATEHQWLNSIRGAQPAPAPVPVAADDGHGRATRSYGDNRAEK